MKYVVNAHRTGRRQPRRTEQLALRALVLVVLALVVPAPLVHAALFHDGADHACTDRHDDTESSICADRPDLGHDDHCALCATSKKLTPAAIPLERAHLHTVEESIDPIRCIDRLLFRPGPHAGPRAPPRST